MSTKNIDSDNVINFE